MVSVVSLLIASAHAYKENELNFLVAVFVYSMIHEAVVANFVGTYSYSMNFQPQIMKIPVMIGLSWATIVYVSKEMGEKMGLRTWRLALFSGVMALSLDIAVDPIATEIGVWSWSWPADFLGVPAGNFFGWFAISFVFVYLSSYLGKFVSENCALSLSVVLTIPTVLLSLALWEATGAGMLTVFALAVVSLALIEDGLEITKVSSLLFLPIFIIEVSYLLVGLAYGLGTYVVPSVAITLIYIIFWFCIGDKSSL